MASAALEARVDRTGIPRVAGPCSQGARRPNEQRVKISAAPRSGFPLNSPIASSTELAALRLSKCIATSLRCDGSEKASDAAVAEVSVSPDGGELQTIHRENFIEVLELRASRKGLFQIMADDNPRRSGRPMASCDESNRPKLIKT